MTADIGLSGAGCTTAVTLSQLVQSSSENDIMLAIFYLATPIGLLRKDPVPLDLGPLVLAVLVALDAFEDGV